MFEINIVIKLVDKYSKMKKIIKIIWKQSEKYVKGTLVNLNKHQKFVQNLQIVEIQKY